MRDEPRMRKSERGIVLAVVLIAIAIVTTLVVDLIYFTQVDIQIASNIKDDIKARYIAKSGIYVAAGTIKKRPLEELTTVASFLGEQSGSSQGRWVINVPYFPIGDGLVSITVVDERSKINLNALVSQTTNKVDQQVLTELKELFRMLGVDGKKSSLFISSLINWLDRPIEGSSVENDQDPSGADAQFYASLENPYSIKNGPLDSVEEIRLIYGMDKEFFEKIKDFVTVYPKDKRINLSTAPKVVIMAALKGASVSSFTRQTGYASGGNLIPDDTAEQIADAILEARKDNPIVDRKRANEIVKSIDPTLQITAGLAGVVLSSGQSDVFSIRSIGSLGEEDSTLRIIDAVIRKDSRKVEIISWKEQ